jgi:hypothetical protein
MTTIKRSYLDMKKKTRIKLMITKNQKSRIGEFNRILKSNEDFWAKARNWNKRSRLCKTRKSTMQSYQRTTSTRALRNLTLALAPTKIQSKRRTMRLATILCFQQGTIASLSTETFGDCKISLHFSRSTCTF